MLVVLSIAGFLMAAPLALFLLAASSALMDWMRTLLRRCRRRQRVPLQTAGLRLSPALLALPRVQLPAPDETKRLARVRHCLVQGLTNWVRVEVAQYTKQNDPPYAKKSLREILHALESPEPQLEVPVHTKSTVAVTFARADVTPARTDALVEVMVSPSLWTVLSPDVAVRKAEIETLCEGFMRRVGFFPTIKLVRSEQLPQDTFKVRLNERELDAGLVPGGEATLAVGDAATLQALEGGVADALFGACGKWLAPGTLAKGNGLPRDGCLTCTPLQYVVLRALDCAQAHAETLLGLDRLQRLIDAIHATSPEITEGLVPGCVSLEQLHAILGLVLRSGHSLRNLPAILMAVRESPNSIEPVIDASRQPLRSSGSDTTWRTSVAIQIFRFLAQFDVGEAHGLLTALSSTQRDHFCSTLMTSESTHEEYARWHNYLCGISRSQIRQTFKRLFEIESPPLTPRDRVAILIRSLPPEVAQRVVFFMNARLPVHSVADLWVDFARQSNPFAQVAAESRPPAPSDQEPREAAMWWRRPECSGDALVERCAEELAAFAAHRAESRQDIVFLRAEAMRWARQCPIFCVWIIEKEFHARASARNDFQDLAARCPRETAHRLLDFLTATSIPPTFSPPQKAVVLTRLLQLEDAARLSIPLSTTVEEARTVRPAEEDVLIAEFVTALWNHTRHTPDGIGAGGPSRTCEPALN